MHTATLQSLLHNSNQVLLVTWTTVTMDFIISYYSNAKCHLVDSRLEQLVFVVDVAVLKISMHKN